MRIPDLSTPRPRALDSLSAARRYCVAAFATLMLCACTGAPPAPEHLMPEHRMPQQAPLVIGHRGASGYRPEHTLASYALAIAQGADVIEPDLVVTRDGVLIARHENEISGTTDVAAHPEFAARRTRKRIDGEEVEGWFAEDFTWEEIRTLRARERLPWQRPDSARFDGQFPIPSFAEVIALAAAAQRPVAIYPETKHATYFTHEGRYLDGRPIQRSLGRLLVEELRRSGFTDPARVYVQSFEVANLIELKTQILPAAGIEVRLMQLFGALDAAAAARGELFALPYDLRFHAVRGDDLDALYPGLRDVLPAAGNANAGYADLATPAVLGWMRARYAYGIATWKNDLLRGSAADPVIGAAHGAGLRVHTYTLRAEKEFLSGGDSLEDEAARLLRDGVDGFFTDNPDRGVAARDAFLRGGAK
jgi:glycerophosphoryl diester phosphodiesterase